MNKIIVIAVLLCMTVLGGFYVFKADLIPPPLVPGNNLPAPDDMIRVTLPKPGDVIKSPVRIEGEARGNWFFEASFPAEIVDADGKQLGIMPVQATADWMTTEFVPFRADLVFKNPATETGFLILRKDNPSGLPEYDDERKIPVKFDLSAVPKRAVKLFYYNPAKDKDSAGNLMCSKNGLIEVSRVVPVSMTPIQDAVKLLLKGELTENERASGITTEYPIPGFALTSASLSGGNLKLTFSDPQNKTGGGACRVGVLWFQIEATAKQFSEVKNVSFLPEELFQP